MQDVAETGNNTILLSELNHPLVSDIATTSTPASTTDKFTVSVTVDCDHPFLSAISMVAPSPDWFVAIPNLDLRGPDGEFVRQADGMLHVYDGGTDAGTTLTAEDKVSDPVQNIAPLQGAPFEGEPLASYTLTRKLPPGCKKATYNLRVRNMWEEPMFENVPEGAVFSPLTAVSHSRRYSAFTLFGYATPGVQNIAELGDNSVFLEELMSADAAPFIRSVAVGEGPIAGGEEENLMLEVDCMHPTVSFISMVAPSPDWIVAVGSLDLMKDGEFVEQVGGGLRVYDAGTDSGEILTAEDEETSPRENIAPLRGEPFNGRMVGRYELVKM